jgi:hypothetical protein
VTPRTGLRLRRLAACAALVLVPPAWAAPFVMGVDHDETTFGGQWMRRVYAEAFRRLDIPLQWEVYPTKRLTVMLEQGAIDGEVQRGEGYAAAHPQLVRVEEPVTVGQFALFVAHPTLRLDRLEELPATELRAQFRRGVVACEKALKQWQPADRLFDVTTTEQGLQNLLHAPAGRLVHCDTELAVTSALYSDRFKGAKSIRKLLVLDESAPMFPYLHRKNAELAPRLAAVLRQMKAEGVIARYRNDVEREFQRR